MPLLHSRTQLITVRLSTQEHEKLKDLCAKGGARSISDFVREIIIHRTSTSGAKTGLLTTDLTTLTVRLQELNAALTDLSDQILSLLGPTESNLARPNHTHLQEIDAECL